MSGTIVRPEWLERTLAKNKDGTPWWARVFRITKIRVATQIVLLRALLVLSVGDVVQPDRGLSGIAVPRGRPARRLRDRPVHSHGLPLAVPGDVRPGPDTPFGPGLLQLDVPIRLAAPVRRLAVQRSEQPGPHRRQPLPGHLSAQVRHPDHLPRDGGASGSLQIGLLDPICLLVRTFAVAIAPASDLAHGNVAEWLRVRAGMDPEPINLFVMKPGRGRRPSLRRCLAGGARDRRPRRDEPRHPSLLLPRAVPPRRLSRRAVSLRPVADRPRRHQVHRL
jgi:hypothetical protein